MKSTDSIKAQPENALGKTQQKLHRGVNQFIAERQNLPMELIPYLGENLGNFPSLIIMPSPVLHGFFFCNCGKKPNPWISNCS